VSGLSDMGASIQDWRKHARAPVDRFATGWWWKSPEEFKDAQRARHHPKVGRMVRLMDAVETALARLDGLT
jgi:hypothetical protein